MSRKGRKPAQLSAGRRLAIMLGSAAATLAAVVLIILGWAVWSYQGPGPEAKAGELTNVNLRRGAGVTEIASTLERAGLIRSSALFIAATQLTGAGASLQAGEYEFPTRASMARILRDIRDGKVVRHQITIVEGMTSRAAMEALEGLTDLTGVAPEAPEGALLPETYQYERGEDRAAVLKRMMDARDELLAQLWQARQPGLPVKTPEEAVILASIVEKETGIAEERPRVAAVFTNRLRQGMKLESDPTIIYGLTGGKPLGRGLRASELARPNPYSTYQIPALPPGPIANPGRAALAAVLDPPKTEELFFVADGTGGHVFAKTYDEHLKNVAKWRAIEREREVKRIQAEVDELKKK